MKYVYRGTVSLSQKKSIILSDSFLGYFVLNNKCSGSRGKLVATTQHSLRIKRVVFGFNIWQNSQMKELIKSASGQSASGAAVCGAFSCAVRPFDPDDVLLHNQVAFYKALAHPTRLWMVQQLESGSRCVCQFVEAIDADFSTISKHLSVLKKAGIVVDRREGKQIFYEIAMPCLFTFSQCVVGSVNPARTSGDSYRD
jgi:ArsR family transcriptional regulator